MEKIKVQILNKSMNPNPSYATALSAGMDIRAMLTDEVIIEPMERKLIPTGIHIALPEGYECQVRPRSGLVVNRGITVLNTPGTIDADYRGEIMVCLINLSDTDFEVHDGDRIAQIVIKKHECCEWEVVSSLDETERGEGAFGHTGIN